MNKLACTAVLAGCLNLFLLPHAVFAQEDCPTAAQEESDTTRAEDEQRSHALTDVDGLHHAALQNNGHYAIHLVARQGWINHADIPSLVGDSDLVVVATATASMVGTLNKRGTSIRTEIEFKVERILAGEPSKDESITVSVPGGTVVYRDGTTAAMHIDNCIDGCGELKPASSYILFLYTAHNPTEEKQIYFPLDGPLGIYGIVNRRVLPYAVPYGGAKAEVASKYAKFPAPAFIQEIITAAQTHGYVESR